MPQFRSTRRMRNPFRPLLLELETRVVPSFIAVRNFDAGFRPRFVTVADVNGDGIPDLVVANYSAQSAGVSVLLGNGDGSFQPAHSFAAGDGPASVVVGDFNGDGIPDLAVADSARFGGTAGVSVLLGNGDGSFQAARFVPVGSEPLSLAVGDFNGDGQLDLALADLNSVNVSVLLGNGDGSFRPPRTFADMDHAVSVAVGDFNGDGIQDLAVADESSAVHVLLGNGDGSFQPARTFTTGAYPTSVAVGDFNGDGIADLAEADRDGVNVLLGNGDGSFQPAHSFAAGRSPEAVAVGDFNGDGSLDLAVADYDGGSLDPNVGVLLGNGDGSFQSVRTYFAGDASRSVAVGDFNRDGQLDLVVADYGLNSVGSNMVSVLLGNGDGSFQSSPRYPAGFSPDDAAVGDFNGDGIPDLAVTDIGGFGGNSALSVLLGNGDGSFAPPQTYAVGSYPYAVVVGDFNGDGIPDLAVANAFSNNVSVLLGNGDGSFQAPRNFSANGSNFVTAADINGDGFLDLITAGSVLLGNGDGTFQPARTFSAGGPTNGVAVGDFNGDGIPDLAVTMGFNGQGGGVSVLLGNGDGSFQPATTFAAGRTPAAVAVGDFNGDGIPDLAVTDTGAFNAGGGVSVLLGNGDGSFQPATTFDSSGPSSSVAVGDFNGDGIPDLVITDSAVKVLLGNGDGSFRSALVFNAASGPGAVTVGDFNGDGRLDLAVTMGSSLANMPGTVSILANDGIWAGPQPGAARGHRAGRGVGVSKRLAAHHPTAAAQAQLAEAVFPDLQRVAPVEATPALPRTSDRLPGVATPAPAPRHEEHTPTICARTAALLPPAVLDFMFADALAASSATGLGPTAAGSRPERRTTCVDGPGARNRFQVTKMAPGTQARPRFPVDPHAGRYRLDADDAGCVNGMVRFREGQLPFPEPALLPDQVPFHVSLPIHSGGKRPAVISR